MVERESERIIYSAVGPLQCATYCVDNDAFICNSFDYCANDRSCHINRDHAETGHRMVASPNCDHFSSKHVNSFLL